ncbi:MAG: hypothetical protein ACPGO5_00565 [Patescibacteria group bacterium]
MKKNNRKKTRKRQARRKKAKMRLLVRMPNTFSAEVRSDLRKLIRQVVSRVLVAELQKSASVGNTISEKHCETLLPLSERSSLYPRISKYSFVITVDRLSDGQLRQFKDEVLTNQTFGKGQACQLLITRIED